MSAKLDSVKAVRQHKSAYAAFSPGRIGAMVMRHVYILRSSLPRLLELAYWPIMQLAIWGFLTQYLATQTSLLAQAGGLLIAAVLLWDVVVRSNFGFFISFMEEMWSRNLGHLAVSPLRPMEFVAALMTMSIIRTVIGVGPAVLLAIPLFAYNIFDLGLPLLAFFVLLLGMGWALGMFICGLLLRFGMGIEGLGWGLVFVFAPISGVWYPVATLPDWLQPIALALPSAHIFEGMRSVMLDGVFHWGHFFWALGLDVLYIAIAVIAFLALYRAARKRGALLSSWE